MVELPNNNCMCNSYINNGIMFGLEKDNAQTWLTLVGLVVVNAVFSLTRDQFNYNRLEVLSAEKLAAKLTPDTSKKVLGWIIDTLQFQIYLSVEKCIKWMEDIKNLLKKGIVQTKELESTIGCLNHAGHIVPLGCYFLNCLQFHPQKCNKWG